jgi:hypothetical protein
MLNVLGLALADAGSAPGVAVGAATGAALVTAGEGSALGLAVGVACSCAGVVLGLGAGVVAARVSPITPPSALCAKIAGGVAVTLGLGSSATA